MSKDTPFHMPQPTPPPTYRTPSLNGGLRPQYTGSSRSPYEHELSDIHERQHAQPRAYDDAYYRWRRGVENDMPQRPPRNSKAANLFATLCCGSVWGIVAWILGLILVVGGFTALLVKTMIPHTSAPAVSSSTVSTVTPLSTPMPSTSTLTTTITTSSAQPSTLTTVSVSTYTPPEAFTVTITTSSPTPIVSISTYTPPQASIVTITTSSPTPMVITSTGMVTTIQISYSTSISTLISTTTDTSTSVSTLTPASVGTVTISPISSPLFSASLSTTTVISTAFPVSTLTTTETLKLVPTQVRTATVASLKVTATTTKTDGH